MIMVRKSSAELTDLRTKHAERPKRSIVKYGSIFYRIIQGFLAGDLPCVLLASTDLQLCYLFKSVLFLVCNSDILCFTSLKLLGLLASENRIKEICLNYGNLNLIHMSDTRMR